MDNIVHNPPPPEEQERLKLLQEELEGQGLTALLERLQQQFKLSVNQIAIAAGMDESALHKILRGENREFKAEQVDALLDNLGQIRGLLSTYERAIWQRALRIAAFIHFDLYKAIEPRLREIEDPVMRIEALKAYLHEHYAALTETYDKSGGAFPMFVPLLDVIASELNRRWGWIRVPFGYRLSEIKDDRYYLVSTDFFPRKVLSLGPELVIKETGFGTYTVHRQVRHSRLVQSATNQTDPARLSTRIFGPQDFVLVPTGSFIMAGSPRSGPQRMAEIPYDYWIARFPVTNYQFSLFVQNTGYWTEGEVKQFDYVWIHPQGRYSTLLKKGDHPVVLLSKRDGMFFCKWLNEIFKSELPADCEYRFPTEAEWEKAARGPDGLIYPWGNSFEKNKCNSIESGQNDTTPVGLYSPQGDSPYGCADMSGNVFEWTEIIEKGYPFHEYRDALIDISSGFMRGGSFKHNYEQARTHYRRFQPSGADVDGGLRVVLAPQEPR